VAVQHHRIKSGTWIEDGPLTIRAEREPKELYVVEVYGELDLSCVATLDAEIRRIEASDVEQIIIDLSGLDFIDSTGIGVLLEAEARSRQNSRRVSFLRGQGSVERVLELVQADSLLTFAD
jgi:anti-sigma B factor antagonist